MLMYFSRAVYLISPVLFFFNATTQAAELIEGNDPAFLVVPAASVNRRIATTPLPKAFRRAPQFLASADGHLIPIPAGQVTTAALPTGCGTAPFAAAEVRLPDGKIATGQLVVVGKAADKHVTWRPAARVQATTAAGTTPDARCTKYKEDYDFVKSDEWTWSGAPVHIRRSSWKAPEARMKACPADALAEVVTANAQDAPCRQLHWGLSDCDGQHGKGQLEELSGVVSSGGREWLIFRSSQYEAHGFSALEIDGMPTLNVLRQTTVQPWGC